MVHTKETLIDVALETYRKALKQLYVSQLRDNPSIDEHNKNFYTVKGIEMVLDAQEISRSQKSILQDEVFNQVKNLYKKS